MSFAFCFFTNALRALALLCFLKYAFLCFGIARLKRVSAFRAPAQVANCAWSAAGAATDARSALAPVARMSAAINTVTALAVLSDCRSLPPIFPRREFAALSSRCL